MQPRLDPGATDLQKEFQRDAVIAVEAARAALNAPLDWTYWVLTCDAGEDSAQAANVLLDHKNLMATFSFSRLNIRDADHLWHFAIHEMLHLCLNENGVLHAMLLRGMKEGETDNLAAYADLADERAVVRMTKILNPLLPLPEGLAGNRYAEDFETAPFDSLLIMKPKG